MSMILITYQKKVGILSILFFKTFFFFIFDRLGMILLKWHKSIDVTDLTSLLRIYYQPQNFGDEDVVIGTIL